MPEYQRERRQLAETLKSLRAAAGLSGAELGNRLGWTQSKVSKIETQKQLPDDGDVLAWARATGAESAAPGLLDNLRRARVEYAAWKDAYRSEGAAGVQGDILALEVQSTRIAEWQPAFVSGLLQTPDYAREIFHLPCGPITYGSDEADVDRMIAVRMQRHQALYDSAKQVQVVMLEAALQPGLVTAKVMGPQLVQLIDFAGLPSLELGIIPAGHPYAVYPMGFRLYDDLVITEAISGESQISELEEVARYEKYMELLRDSASTGADAVAIIRRVLASLEAN